MMRNFLTAIVCLLICTMLGGCAPRHLQIYPGEARAAKEISVLRVGSVRGAKIGILGVDGKSGDNLIMKMATGRHGALSAAVLPGKHYVGVHINTGLYSSAATLWWVAKAGRNYELRGNISPRSANLYVVDLTTGRVTGGIRGSEDEPPL